MIRENLRSESANGDLPCVKWQIAKKIRPNSILPIMKKTRIYIH